MRKNKRSEWRQAYNAQAVVDAEGSQLVLGSGEFLRERPARVGCGCGYDSQGLGRSRAGIGGQRLRVGFGGGAAGGPRPVGAEDRRRAHDFRPPAEGKAPKDPKAEWLKRMKEKMETEENRALYRLRKQTVEPVFGIVKEAMGFRRFLLRGLTKVEGEWALVTLAYNCKRLHRLKMA